METLFDINASTSTPDDKTNKRKNNPELLRHTILICAKNLMLDIGISNLSVQKVADMAGTSKGGLFHHFKSKDELVTSVVELFIAQVNTAILSHIDKTPTQKGVFTKAYIHVFFDNPEIGLSSDWSGLIRSIHADSTMSRLWFDWISSKLIQHQHTDDDFRLYAIRCAVDGAWSNNTPSDELPAMRAYLLELVDNICSK